MGELLARLRAATRRATPRPDEAPVVTTDAFTVDLAAKRVSRDGEDVHLTPPSGTCSRCWSATPAAHQPAPAAPGRVGPAVRAETNYLRVYFAQLRRKLEVDPAAPAHLITEPGMGYRFEP
jgi:two-component system KDP operon response regulator KdpE